MLSKSSPLSSPSFLLVGIATLMLQLAICNLKGSLLYDWLQLGVALTLAIVVHFCMRPGSNWKGHLLSALCLTLLVGLALLWDVIQRWLLDSGNPFEILVALSLRNMMIGLVANSSNTRSQNFATLASCFLALFSTLWLMNGWTIALLLAYTIVGMWWLMGTYWDRLSGCFLSHSERSIPWLPVCSMAALGGLAVLLILPLTGGPNYTTAIQGFLPSSGGSRWQDANANGGIGDGPQMVSAKDNASSFGPIESELFLESKMPSLYDVYNEFSEAPVKMKKNGRRKSIPLAPSEMQPNHQRRGVNKQAGREFSTVRRKKQKTPETNDLRSTDLLQVVGRVPVHLGLYTYDLWDGRTLSTSIREDPRPLLFDVNSEDGKGWVRFAGMGNVDLIGHRDRHELRVINLKTDRIPSPPNISGVHIDKLHTEKFFKTTEDGMLGLDMKSIPQLTVFHVESLQRSSSDLPKLVVSKVDEGTATTDTSRLAREWTDGIQRGWPQVEAISDHLRQEYLLDREAMLPEEIEDGVAHFLLEAKQGPDYLFATSAALLLRSLGYETRVVSGFYANAENYHHKLRLTSVGADDAHFWVEVLSSYHDSSSRIGSLYQHRWIAFDASPGYEVLLAPDSLWSQLLMQAAYTLSVLRSNPLSIITSFVLFSLVWHKKVFIADIAITSWWRIQTHWGDVHHQVISTLRLLDRRARVHGRKRAQGVSLNNWTLSASEKESNQFEWEKRFADLANWALYGDGHLRSHSREEVDSLCEQVAALAFRQSKSPRIFTKRVREGSL